MQRVYLQPAFVLHTRPYRDTSILINLFTLEYGRLALLSRGGRGKNSKVCSLMQPFRPLLVSFSAKTNLSILSSIEPSHLGYNLKERALLSAFYLNELLMRLVPEGEQHSDLFHLYQETLTRLALPTPALEVTLRLFEKNLLKALGYEINLVYTLDQQAINEQQHYLYEFGQGFRPAKPPCLAHHFTGHNLLALHHEQLNTQQELEAAKRLLKPIIAHLLDYKPLKSRELFTLP